MSGHEKSESLSAIYDDFATTYAEGRGVFDVSEVLAELLARLPARGHVVDLGCGAGEPVGTTFLARGWTVTGVDASAGMLSLAEHYAPDMVRLHADMREVDLPAESFDAVTAVYSVFHLPANDQPVMWHRIHRWLRPGGLAMFTYATRAYTGHDRFDGTIEFMGRALPYSHVTVDELKVQLVSAGLTVVDMREREIGGETMLWVTVQRDRQRSPGPPFHE